MATQDEIREALEAAGTSHHEFEMTYLKGLHDELWPGYYAAFVLGRLPDLEIAPSRLASLLAQAEGDDWATTAAVLVATSISPSAS